ncbi:MAG: 1,4-dihydroxy-6-naphthoate synthase [Planctomycetaceae bacterium]|nr:1,4-dihydroxy-6-naphthoate synthase [Planctomycetaceae bacterium]
MKIRIGISTCPNDTFAFSPLLDKRLDTDGLEFEFCLLDVQELNERLRAGDLDVGKASFHAALSLSERYGVFAAGAALGFGNGPLLLARPGITGSSSASINLGTPDRGSQEPVSRVVGPNASARVLCPGQDTTAHLLFRLFYPGVDQVDQVVFSEIAPALLSGRADYGVCIHEGRFTYHQQGLGLVEDLGQRWEMETGSPLPLGGILGRLDLGAEVLGRISRLIQASVRTALTQRELALPMMRFYAQEFADEVLWAHVDLYVNRWTVDLGRVGLSALQELGRRAATCGLVAGEPQWTIISA